MVDELSPAAVGARVDALLLQPAPELGLVPRPQLVPLERLHERQPAPGRREVDRVLPELDLGRSECLVRHGGDELLDPPHRVLVVRVGLVPLEHRELGVVLERDALVAEVLADLVDALEAADDQPLEVELGRDAQVQLLVELVVVGGEGSCEGSAVTRLQDRRLDLHEAVRVEVAADGGDDARAQEEVARATLVHQQVEVAAPIARLGVGEAVEGVRQRPLVLRQQDELVDGEATARRGGLGRRARSRRRCRRGRRRSRPVRPVSARSWMRPVRSTRSRKTSLP